MANRPDRAGLSKLCARSTALSMPTTCCASATRSRPTRRSPRSSRRAARDGRDPMLVFDQVEGLGARVATNLFASRTRMGRMLGVDAAQLHETYQQRTRQPFEPRLLACGPISRYRSKSRPSTSRRLPLIKHFETDRAPYITNAMIVAQHPDTGHRQPELPPLDAALADRDRDQPAFARRPVAAAADGQRARPAAAGGDGDRRAPAVHAGRRRRACPSASTSATSRAACSARRWRSCARHATASACRPPPRSCSKA